MLAPWKKSYDKPRQCIKKQRHHFANKGLNSQSYDFSSSHVWMWELNHKEGWVPKNWYFWTMVLEKTLESPLDNRRSNQSILKEINPEYSLKGTDAEALILWPHDAKSQLIEKDLDAGKDWGQEEKGRQRMRWLDGITNSMDKSLSILLDSEGQGSLARCNSWGHKELDTTWRLNNNKGKNSTILECSPFPSKVG